MMTDIKNNQYMTNDEGSFGAGNGRHGTPFVNRYYTTGTHPEAIYEGRVAMTTQ
jgi:hypothetical protein